MNAGAKDFPFADDLGPAKVLHLYDASVPLRAVLVVDNVAAGPAMGGVRMAPDVSSLECFRLARAMTLKNAVAELPHGGAKTVVFADPRMPQYDKERAMRALARALRDVHDYIAGPDMGTDERCMAWMQDERTRVGGLPRELGGIPLNAIGATGWGLAHAVGVAAERIGLRLEGARLVVQGFGAVGRHTARFLAEMGAVLVAASDTGGAIYDSKGLDVEKLGALKAERRSVIDHGAGTRLDGDALIDVECDVWVPAARPDVIREDNALRLRTRIVAEGANIPCTPTAERMLHERGIVCLPDFIANAGGVICAAMELHGLDEGTAMQRIGQTLRKNARLVLERAQASGVPPREVALRLATERIRGAMQYRRPWRASTSTDG
jgi:glutamate dehydrogenase (NAD(P)+)